MTFRGTQSIIVLLVILSIFSIFVYQYSKPFVVILILIMAFSLLYGFTSYIKIDGSKIVKKSMLLFSYQFDIKEIKLIEAITEKKAGYIYIRIGRSDPEDYYILHMRNNSKIRMNAYFKNKGISVGRYLKKEYNIQFKERDTIKYFY